ncbi:MAG: nucleotidyltransferase family protein [Deltaproteobacteria bacterium]|nr:MAG: nucleotidyltransferase family protein [Deltaproteobacteria bacterium]
MHSIYISALLLAAGEGTRMGGVKQLFSVGEKSMVEVSLSNLQASNVDEIMVVLGFAADMILPLIEGKDRVKVVMNPYFREGMSSSLHRGLRAVDPQTKGVLIALADQPFISPEVIDLLIERFAEGSKGIVLPVYQGQGGHPVIFDRERYEGDLFELRGDVGGKEVVRRHPEDVLEVEVSSSEVLLDIDEWDEYTRIQEE